MISKRSSANLRKSKKKRETRLASIFDYPDPDFIMIKYVCNAHNGPAALLLVVSHLFAVPVLGLCVGLEKDK
jgi:hypothetical protein